MGVDGETGCLLTSCFGVDGGDSCFFAGWRTGRGAARTVAG